MLLKKFVLFKFINIGLLLSFSLLVVLEIYFNGSGSSKVGEVLIFVLLSLLPATIFPSVFFGIHFWYYRDKEVKQKLVITTIAAILSILFIASFWIDKSSDFLEKKKVISFTIGFLFIATSIIYTANIIKTNK